MSPVCDGSGSGCDPDVSGDYYPGLGYDPGSWGPCPACDGTGDDSEEEETGR